MEEGDAGRPFLTAAPGVRVYERVDDGGGSGGGDNNPGGDDTGDAIVWTIGSANQSWAAETHDTYGAGFSASDNDIKVGYYKNTSTTTPVTANDDHIRVYKYSVLIVTPTGGKKVKKVVLETTGANYTSNLNVLDPGSGTATASSTTITWTGTAVTPWIGYAANGQVRVKKITVELE